MAKYESELSSIASVSDFVTDVSLSSLASFQGFLVDLLTFTVCLKKLISRGL